MTQSIIISAVFIRLDQKIFIIAGTDAESIVITEYQLWRYVFYNCTRQTIAKQSIFDQPKFRLLSEFGASTISQLTIMLHSYCTVQMLSNKHLSAASNLIIQRSIDVTNLRLWCHIRSNFRPRALLLVLYSTSVMYRCNNLLRTASLVFQPRENPTDVSGFYSPSIFLLIRFSTATIFFFLFTLA